MGGRVKVLEKLLKSKEITEVINACDAGREGELIFRYIYQYAKSDKPIRRLWLQSMTRRRDPRRLRAPAHRCRNAAACRGRPQPQRSRLACRHQRHARVHAAADRRQRQHRHVARSRPDADAGNHRGPRKEDREFQAARLVRGVRQLSRRGRQLCGAVV